MLRPVISRLPTRRKPFPRLASPLSSSCAAPLSPRIIDSVTRQRRNSSSKPSSSAPPNDSEASAVSTTPESASSRKKGNFSKAGSRVKAKEVVPAAGNGLSLASGLGKKEESYAIPSVPSTQHLHLQDITVAQLFAFHRPISIHNPLPQSITPKRFSQIFAPRPSPAKPQPSGHSDVIDTIQSTVSTILKDLEKTHDPKSVSRVVVSDSAANANVFDKAQNNKEPNYITPEGTAVFIDIEAMVRNLPPFEAPPAPRPLKKGPVKARATKRKIREEFFTAAPVELEVFEEPDANSIGEAEITESETFRTPSTPFLDRLWTKHIRYLERNREMLYAISVKRQRRLKMKKHKFKKLMKRTKNLRRRLDKLG